MTQVQVLNKELFSPDFLQNNPELLKIQEINVEVDEKLASALTEYENIKKQVGEIKTETILESCKETVVANLCEKFAINRLIALDDKDGGAVTTLHNAKNQVFANDKDRNQFNRAYNDEIYHEKNNLYKQRKQELEKLSEEGKLTDIYTGENISGKRTVIDKNGNACEKNIFDTEHKNSAKGMHDRDEFRFAYDEKSGADLVNSKENLGATRYDINRSKGEKDLDDWKGQTSTKDATKTNEEYYGIDAEYADKQIKDAKEFLDKNIAKAKLKKYSKELSTTSLSVGGKTFLYSAIGQISVEFVRAVFDSLVEAFRNRHTKSLAEILDIFKSHIRKAIEHIKSNWKEILSNSFEGALMNVLNNLLVFAINLVATTLKNVVSMIRAGFTTVCSAIKMLCNPPKNMTEDERNDAVCKILVFGMVEVSSLALTESVTTLLQTIGLPKNITDVLVYPMTALMGGIVASVILGIMQKAKSDAKKEKLHVTLIAQNNVVLQAQIIQNWCILAQGNYLLKEKAEQFDETVTTMKSEMEEREKEIESSLNDTDEILNRLRNYRR